MEIQSIVDIVILKDNKLLMVQEGKKHCFKEWNLPAGHIEYGENIFDSAIREAKEETGYDVKILALRKVYNYKSERETHVIRFSFLGEIISGNIKFDGKEILDVKWFSLEELDNMPDNQLRGSKIIRQIIDDTKKGELYPLEIIDNSM